MRRVDKQTENREKTKGSRRDAEPNENATDVCVGEENDIESVELVGIKEERTLRASTLPPRHELQISERN